MHNKTEKQSINTYQRISNFVNKNEARLITGLTIKQLIDAYIESKSVGWSLSSQRTEASRLYNTIDMLEQYGLNPFKIYNELQKTMRAYTIKTIFIRISSLIDFGLKYELLDGRLNQFREFMSTIAPNNFKTVNVYKKKHLSTNFDEAYNNILNITNDIVKDTLIYLLKTGLRISELYKIKNDNGEYFVKGKGGKIRQILFEPPKTIASLYQIRLELSKLNLTPHDLRRLCATHLINNKLNVNEVQQVFGWSSIATANNYIQQVNNNELKTKIIGVLNR